MELTHVLTQPEGLDDMYDVPAGPPDYPDAARVSSPVELLDVSDEITEDEIAQAMLDSATFNAGMLDDAAQWVNDDAPEGLTWDDSPGVHQDSGNCIEHDVFRCGDCA